ncbi:putative ATPase [Allocatelliglobosispora scoriae]|uniref:Putative ATPase n=1 Tax=Allocatelliglobosispora scoriae TaxID=643052 RepID=A0A841C2B3_9ACTN|nr:AAA family ATPase [Allocatelliglobosispora scoriae]MBB5873192.1 putative ATPase [Allocatelliglobosispora scoriae]
MITALAVENYRSLRRLIVPLGRLNIVTGANGSGKSSLYRALRLLADSSRNGAIAALAQEGGLPSALWAGPEKLGRSVREGRHPVQGTVSTGPARLLLGFAGDEFGYAVDLGMPVGTHSAFNLDPEIKREVIWTGPILRPATLLTERGGTVVRIRSADGSWQEKHSFVQPFDSMLSELADPQRAPDILRVREALRSWRFYDHVRTDARAPARSAQIGTRTPVLSHDGSDVAAALQTILEIGDRAALEAAVERAFPGSEVEIRNSDGRFELTLHQHGLLRPLRAPELSDGTLRYLLWIAALLTPRPPALLVLNEPETSLHPELLRPLAELVITAARHTQVVVVTHSRPFAAALEQSAAANGTDAHLIELVKEFGQTTVADQGILDEPPWQWPKR